MCGPLGPAGLLECVLCSQKLFIQKVFFELNHRWTPMGAGEWILAFDQLLALELGLLWGEPVSGADRSLTGSSRQSRKISAGSRRPG